MNNEFITCRQVSKMIGVAPGSVYALMNAGIIPFYRIGRKSVRFDREEIEEWIRSCYVQKSYSSNVKSIEGDGTQD